MPTWKHVHSRDPLKPAIVAALKAASNCRKVTLVKMAIEQGEVVVQGNCMNPNDATSTPGIVFTTL